MSDDARVWDRFARRYDLLVRAFDRSYPRIRALLAEDLAGRSRILEVAAGTGQFTVALARVADSLVATDVSPKMVQRLEEVVRRSGVSNTQVSVMDAYALDADTGAFDGAFCANALHVMGEPERAISELWRVLGRDGRLVVPTFLHGAGWVRRSLSRAISAATVFRAHSRFDLDSLCAFIEAAGFVVERRLRLPGLFPIGYVAARRV